MPPPVQLPEPIRATDTPAALLPAECGGQVDLSDPDSWVFPEDDGEDEDDSWGSDSDSDGEGAAL